MVTLTVRSRPSRPISAHLLRALWNISPISVEASSSYFFFFKSNCGKKEKKKYTEIELNILEKEHDKDGGEQGND